ncbi:YhjD/YihY/BrkB family envelope integrity protein [Nocardiopsis ansamitocini]|uniref:YihY/virulence factor BrkB family protein n=1 Tax=Nocardiopsis ansamitocini TaxID=1670832 RepID=A0A9W6P9Q2_9ACTN|nr:YhjD/YihY/BrkB family envelope integrity protein [Nocardiopsis ansamitocini]GLU49566.1 hypothetical protein Nans01_39170 [Nocardiopsis ansamitocini]
MTSLSVRVRTGVQRYQHAAMDYYWALRERRPGIDHIVRAYERYADQRGNQLAASVTYFSFLSFFPLIALAFSVLGYVAVFDMGARSYMEQAIDDLLPGLAEQLPIDQVAQARTGAGVIGLLGLLYAGLGAIAALREALHIIWLKNPADGPNFLLAKLWDVVVVVLLGAALLASVAFTSVAQAATSWLLSWVALDGAWFALVATRLLGLAIAITFDTFIFMVLFARLSGTRRPWRLLWRGALLGAVGFEALKALGALLIAGTLSNPVFASFAVVVGLLVWINVVLRFVIFAAAWTATWLPIQPPYLGAVPMSVPVSASAAEPAVLTRWEQRSVHYCATLPARPSHEQALRSERLLRNRRLVDRARSLATPLLLGTGAFALLVWSRHRRTIRRGR